MWLQWLHPTIVHFAIGLLFTAVFFDIAGLWRESEKLLAAGYWNTLIGAIAALFAVGTGILASSRLGEVNEIGGALLPFHQIAAWTGTILALLLAGWRIAMKGAIRKKLRTLYLATAMLTALALFTTGALGGALVYAYGLGITPDAARRVVEAHESSPSE